MEKEKFNIDVKELEQMKEKSEKFWKVINQCKFTTHDEKDKAASELGIAPTPKGLVYQEGTMKLYSYFPKVKPDKKIPPVLIVPSLINKNYILDLVNGFSLIEFLTLKGVRVYIIDWGTAGEEHGELTIDNYITGYIRRCVKKMSRHSEEKKYILLGQCIGGILTTIYSALFSDDKNLVSHVAMTTPVNFENGGKLKEWTNPETFNLDKVVNSYRENGAIPPEILHAGFQFLDLNLTFTKYRNLFNFVDNEAFVKLYRALDFWGNDNIPFPVMVFKKFIKAFYQQNQLIRGELIIDDKYVNLCDIKIPFFNILASNDHVFPKEAAIEWKQIMAPHKGDVEKVYDGGHVSIVAALPVRLQLYNDIYEFIK